MIKVFEKCIKCFNEYKCWTETKAKLLECPDYISKRSTKINRNDIRQENLKAYIILGLDKGIALNQKSPIEF